MRRRGGSKEVVHAEDQGGSSAESPRALGPGDFPKSEDSSDYGKPPCTFSGKLPSMSLETAEATEKRKTKGPSFRFHPFSTEDGEVEKPKPREEASLSESNAYNGCSARGRQSGYGGKL